MSMAERARRIKANTFLLREEAKAERAKRKAMQTTKWEWDWAKGDYIQYTLVDEPITIVQAALKLEKGLITNGEFANFVEEGPPQGTAVEIVQGISADVAAGAERPRVLERNPQRNTSTHL